MRWESLQKHVHRSLWNISKTRCSAWFFVVKPIANQLDLIWLGLKKCTEELKMSAEQ